MNYLSLLTFLLHDLLLLCSFFISHPLILTYLLLLFPYLLKLLFLLYPLLFSTSLLLLALLTSTSSHFPSTTSIALLNFLQPQLSSEEPEAFSTDQLFSMVFVDPHLNDSKAKDCKAKSIQRDGSMRREKEWKRTLACKLFEERMVYKLCDERKVVDGAEEMDLLWEAYEVDATKSEKQRRKENVEEEEAKLCCLQAFKLSSGKPSLLKVSMALKGMSVFHRGGRRRKFTN